MVKRIFISSVLISGLLFLFLGCSKKTFNNVYFRLNPKDHVVFESYKTPYGFDFLKFVYSGNDTFLLAANYNYKPIKIITYDWKGRKLINSEEFSPNAPAHVEVAKRKILDSWCYVSSDSFFWFYRTGTHPTYVADSVYYRQNIKGETLEILNEMDIPRMRTANKSVSRDSTVYISVDDSRLMVENGKIFVTFKQGFSRPGWKNFCKIPYEVGGHIEYINGKHQFTAHPVYFPEFARKHHYPSQFTDPVRVINHRGNPVYGFWMTPTYTEYDMKTGKTTTHHVKHSFIDTILPAPADTNGNLIGPDEQWNKTGGEFFYFYFDPYRKQYLRFLKLPPPAQPTIEELNMRRYGIALMDSNFKLLGEALLPEELQPSTDPDKGITIWPRLFIAPEGIYFLNISESYKREGEAVIYCRYDFTPTNRKPVLYPHRKKGITSDSWLAYLNKEYKHKPKDELILFVPVDHSCEPCRDFVLEYYKKYRKEHPEKAIRLIAAAKKQEELDKYIADTAIIQSDSRTFLDPKARYLKYVMDFVNPRVIIIQNGKIIKDQILNPAQIPDLPQITNDYFTPNP